MKIKNLKNKIIVILLLVVSLGIISSDTSAQIPPYYNNNTATPSNTYPFAQNAGMHYQAAIVAGAITGAPIGMMDTLWIKTNPNVTRTYSSLDIGIKQTAGLTIGSFTPGPFTNIFTATSYVATSNASGWLAIPLTTNYSFDPSLPYVLDIIQCGCTGGNLYVSNFSVSGNGRTYSNIAACPQTYSNQAGQFMALGVSLTGTPTPPYANDYSATSSGNSYPLGSGTSNNRVQFLYGPGQFSTLGGGAGTVASGTVDKLWVRVGSTSSTTFGSKTYTNLEISVAQNMGTATTLTGNNWSTGLTTVFSANSYTMTYSALDEWIPITLNTPFTYYPAQSLMIEIKHSGSTGSTVYMADDVPTYRRYGTNGSATASSTSNNGYMIGMSANSCINTAANVNATICSGYTYTSPSTNHTWTTAGTYTDTIGNAGGCDSILTINLSVLPNSTNSISATACNSYTSPSTNHTWTTSGTYQDTLGSANNCDSILTINLTINNSTNSSMNVSACKSYTSPSSNYTWTTSGTYQDTILNAANCDSIITINLTINTISSLATTVNGITITATNATATYVWLDCNNNYAPIAGATSQSFTPTANGNYAVEITENGCVDTSACVPITTVGIIENAISKNIQVYPNPTKDKIQIELDTKNGIDLEFKLVDMNGRIIQTMPVKTMQGVNLYNMNISNNANGIYHLQVYENGQLVYTEKVRKD